MSFKELQTELVKNNVVGLWSKIYYVTSDNVDGPKSFMFDAIGTDKMIQIISLMAVEEPSLKDNSSTEKVTEDE